MKVADFLELNELTGAGLANLLGYTGSEAVNARRRRDEDVPEAWLPKIAELGLRWEGDEPLPAEAYEQEPQFRDADTAPRAPEGARQAPAQVQVDYASIAGYIEGAYKLAAQMAVAPNDPLLAQVIDEHAAAAGTAWAHWIESEPRVAALLQKLMIGTPLGEVIGVHVGIVFSYTLARSAAREIAAEHAARSAAAEVDGSAPATPAD